MNTPIIESIMYSTRGFVDDTLERDYQTENAETKAAEKAISDFCKRHNIDIDKPTTDLNDDFRLLLVGLEQAREDLGFINGFRFGVRLMQECK